MASAGKLKALMMVAHPDDCVIFGFPFYSTHKNFEWSVCYLTYENWDWRAQELTKFWKSRSVATSYLGFTDDYREVDKGNLGFDGAIAIDKIKQSCSGFDLILTHNQNGDYGHIHHVFVHDAVKELSVNQLYFAGIENFNYQCVCGDNEYDLDELPRHRSVIEGFNDRLIGRYFVPDSVRNLI